MRQYTILDVQGRLLRRFHGSNDTSITGENGKSFSSWQAAFEDFLHQFLFPILEQGTRPMDILAVWDKGNTHRLNIDSTYKEKRLLAEKDPIFKAEVTKLFEEAQTFLAYIGCKNVWVPGEEADDVIALLCQKLEGTKVIYTGDKDLLQLVNEDTSVNYNGEFHSLQYSTHKHPLGVPYALTSFYKSLVGDSSDGFNGVPNFGPKAFEKLMAQYGEQGLLWMADVIDRDAPEELKPYADADPVVKKIWENWPHTRKGWKLASLAPQAAYGVYKAKPKRPEWRVRVPNKDRIRRLLGEVYSVTAGATEDAALEHAMCILEKYFPTETLLTAADAAILPAVMSEVLASPIAAYDFESSDKLQHPEFRKASGSRDYVDVLSQELAGISVNYGQHSEKTVYIPFDHKDTPNFSKDWAVWILQTLSSRDGPTVVQNASFELSVSLANLGYMPAAPYDTQIQASYVDENEEAGLKQMSQRVLNYSQLSYRETTQGRAMFELTGAEVLSYGCDDSLVTTALFDLYRMIMELEGSWSFYRDNEVEPAVDDAYSFVTGTVLDFERLKVLQHESAERLRAAEARVREALGRHVRNDEARIARGAQTLLSEAWVTERFKVTDDPSGEKAQAKYAELWQKAWNLSCYTPMVETSQPAKTFAPTPTLINTAIGLIDPAAPRVTKLTQAALTDFDDAFTKYLSGKPMHECKELEAFVGALFAARKDLGAGKRNTPAYHEFAAFGQEILDRGLKPAVKRSGTLLNFGSPQQMQAMLYSLLELPIRRRTKKAPGSLREKEKLVGSPATGIKAIATALAFDVPEGDWRRPVLEDYRTVSQEQQLESLYFQKWSLWVHPRDGRVHPAIRNCGTVTRRPSGTNLNVLQIAKGPMRTAFRPGKGRVVVSLDLVNEELVLLACESRDPVLLDAFMSTPRKDIHTVTSLGFAPMLLPRLGGPSQSSFTYEEFHSALHSDDAEIAKPFKQLRNKYSKACIAEGSLVLTDSGLVPIQEVQLHHQVWDGVEWVAHEGVIYKGIREVMTYDGLTATPDHEVYLDDGSKCSALSAFERAAKLAVGESEGFARPYLAFGERGVYGEGEVGRLRHLSGMWRRYAEKVQQHFQRGVLLLRPLHLCRVHQRRAETDVEVFLDAETLRGRDSERLSVLRGSRNRSQIQELFGVQTACLRSPSGLVEERDGDRPNRQRRSLRAWEFARRFSFGKLSKHAQNSVGRLLWEACSSVPRLASAENGLSGVSVHSAVYPDSFNFRGDSGNSPETEKANEALAVYDIVNAGPRHRFTVSGKVVANCNFLMAYSGGFNTLAENLSIHPDLAKDILNKTFALYARVQPWQNEVAQFARTHGYSQTAYGNRRHVTKDIHSSDDGLRKRMERQATNATIQGTAADILKVIRQRMIERDMRQRYKMESVYPVYDELTASVPIELALDYAFEMKDIMEVTPPGYPVGMATDLSIGPTWGTQKELSWDREKIETYLSTLENQQ